MKRGKASILPVLFVLITAMLCPGPAFAVSAQSLPDGDSLSVQETAASHQLRSPPQSLPCLHPPNRLSPTFLPRNPPSLPPNRFPRSPPPHPPTRKTFLSRKHRRSPPCLRPSLPSTLRHSLRNARRRVLPLNLRSPLPSPLPRRWRCPQAAHR